MAFELSYAGVFFPLDTPDVMEIIESRISLRDLKEIVPIQDQPVFPNFKLAGAAIPNFLTRPDPRIGTFFYPSGASRWAEFHGFATTTQVAAMKKAALTNLATPQTFKIRSDNPVGDPLAQQGVSTAMYLLPPRPLVVFSGQLEGLWLITLVDERYYWQFRDAGKQQISAASSTWANLFTSLATALGITLDTGAINSVYGIPAEDSPLFSNFENAAVLLDAAAWNVGKLVVRNFDGTYNLRTPAESTDVAQQNRAGVSFVLAGGDIFQEEGNAEAPSQNAILPATVTVTFPRFVINGKFVDNRDSRDHSTPSYGDVYSKIVSLADAGHAIYSGHSGTKTIHDSARAYYNAASDPSPANQADLDALALQLAKDYYDAQLSGIDQVFPGIRAWEPEGVDDLIWTYRGAATWTRIQRMPWNYGVSELQHDLSTIGGGVGPGSNPGNLSVRELDGSPTVLNVSTLTLDQTDGFVVSTPAAGEARIDLASAAIAQRGIVSLTAQTVGAGNKTFGDSVAVLTSFFVGSNFGAGGVGVEALFVLDATFNVIARQAISIGVQTSVASFTPGARIGFNSGLNQKATIADGSDWGFLCQARDGNGGDITAGYRTSGGTAVLGIFKVATGAGFGLTADGITQTSAYPSSITVTGGIITAMTAGSAPGTGTVTSVALTMPSIFSVAGSPITTSGTFTVTFATETANTVFAGPASGGAATPTFRALVAADIPNISAAKITSGTLLAVRGGTGTVAYTAGDILYADSTTTLTVAPAGTTGQVFTQGPSAIPVWNSFEQSLSTKKGCSLWRTTNKSIADSTTTAIDFDAESGTQLFDAGNLHAASGTKITVPTGFDGMWVFHASVLWQADASPSGQRSTYIVVDSGGTVTFVASELVNADVNNQEAQSVSCVLNLVAGDFVECQVFQNSGGPLNVEKQDRYSPVFSCAYLGK